jgi:hypothetical protein
METQKVRLHDGTQFFMSEPILVPAVGLPRSMMRDGVPIIPAKNCRAVARGAIGVGSRASYGGWPASSGRRRPSCAESAPSR